MIYVGSYTVKTTDQNGKAVTRKAKVISVAPFGRGYRVTYTLMGQEYKVGLKTFDEMVVSK